MSNPPIGKHEWNFADCSDEEKETCFHYEYAREYLRLHPELASGLDAQRASLKAEGPIYFFHPNPARPDTVPLECKLFPVHPWLDITKSERSKLRTYCTIQSGIDLPQSESLLVNDNFDISVLHRLSALRDKMYNEWKAKDDQWFKDLIDNKLHGGTIGTHENDRKEWPQLCLGPKHFYRAPDNTSYAIIKIDSRYSANELLKEFKDLLHKHNSLSPDNTRKPNRGGRGKEKEQLEQLGALRLLNHFGTADKAVDFLSTQAASRYADPSSLSKAAGKAIRNLERLAASGRFRPLGKLS